MLQRLARIPQTLFSKASTIEMPRLTKDADIDVYLVHNSADAEDYFFLFDFEQFTQQSKGGWFVRPRLKIWAGRSDFNRRSFARQFRNVFAAEFDILREKNARGQSFGWIGLGSNLLWPVALVTTIVVNLLLLSALGLQTDKTKRRRARRIEDDIEETKSRVEEALTRIEIVLHGELYSHAYRNTTPGRLTGMDYQAWPLPGYVREHLSDGRSSSWW